MSLRFRYRLYSQSQPALTLGGRFVRPRPVIPVTVIGPSDTRARDAQLDTAADETIFSANLASDIGLDLTHAPAGLSSGVGIGTIPVRYAEVTLRITTPDEQREWKAWVGFTTARLPRPLLGFAGCLQFFSANFLGDREEVELTVNSLYPGS